MTFQELADSRLKDKTYDWAIPQLWFNFALKVSNNNPSGHVVWLYDEQARIGGRPFGLTLLGWMIIRMVDVHYENHSITM